MRPLLFSQPRRGLANANIAPAPASRRVGNQARLRACERTRGFGEPAPDDEDVTAATDIRAPDTSGDVLGGPAGGVPGWAAAGPPGGPGPPQHCAVDSGPTHTPSGSVPVVVAGGRKNAVFSLRAVFRQAASKNQWPGCCQVRQYIKWDHRYHASKGGPPHGGFPASTPADTWIEDRDATGARYGHRSGPNSSPQTGCWDEYLLNGTRDQTHGDTYCGRDRPAPVAARVGTWSFYLTVEDTCRSGEVARSPVTSINWG